MSNARAVEDSPLRLRNRALLADRQRDNHARIRRARQCAHDAFAHRRARALHVVGCAARKRCEPHVRIIVAHVTCRAEAVLQQPRFDIETVRVHRSVRTLEADDQAPALPCDEIRDVVDVAILAALRIPRERQMLRNRRAFGFHALDG